MDDFSFDDDSYRPRRPLDVEAGFAEARKIHDSTPPEVHQAAEDYARQYFSDADAKEVLGRGANSVALVEDELVYAKLKDLPADMPRDEAIAQAQKEADAERKKSAPAEGQVKDASENPGGAAGADGATGAPKASSGTSLESPAEATGLATGLPPAGDEFGMPGAAVSQAKEGGPDARVPAPTSFDSALSKMVSDTSRDQRFVIVGNDDIKRLFMAKLTEMGKVTYKNGTPVANLSRKEATELLREVAKEVPGATVSHAVSLTVDRNGYGLFGSARAAIANTLNRKHEIDVMVVGREPEKSKELTGLATTLSRLEKAQFFGPHKEGEPSKLPLANGQLELRGDSRPVTLQGARDLLYLIDSGQQAVAAYDRQKLELEQARKDVRAAKEDQAVQQAKDKEAALSGGKPAVSAHAVERAKDLVEAMASPEKLSTLHPYGKNMQTKAVELTVRSAHLKPAEVATLPQDMRERFVMQLAELSTRSAGKEFDQEAKQQKIKKLEQPPAASGERIQEFITAERARGNDFELRAAAYVEEAKASGRISEAVAEKLHEAFGSKDHVGKLEQLKQAAAESATSSPDKAQDKPAEKAPEAATEKAADAPSEKAPTAETSEQKVAAAEKVEPAKVEPAAAERSQEPPKESGAEPLKPSAVEEGVTKNAAEQAVSQPTARESGEADRAAAEGGKRSFRDRVEALAAAGPQNLTESQARSLVAEVDAMRTKPLSALDDGKGAGPSQTLQRVESLLQPVASGRFGPELQAYAGDLQDTLSKWQKQDAQRLQQDSLVGKEPAAAKAPEQASAVEPAKATAAKPETVAPVEPPRNLEQERARAEELRKQGETEAAAGKLSSLMSNPAGSFTNRDKTWNESNIQAAAQSVLRLDVSSVAQMSPSARTQLAGYSAWMADNAARGKLPGFDSEQGKEVAAQLVNKTTELINLAEGKMPAAAQKNLEKAERLVEAQPKVMARDAGAQQGKSSSMETEPTRSISPQQASSMAKDLVHAVYKDGALSEPYVKNLLKNAKSLTPDALKSLDTATKAKTAVALAEVVSLVKEGGLGEYSSLSPALRNNVDAAQGAADALQTELSKTGGSRSALNAAYAELRELNSEPAAAPAPSSAAKDGAQAKETSEAKTEASGKGRDLER